jgi:hypothetical protein
MSEHQTDQAPRNRVGRPSKGPREEVKGRVPVTLAQRFREDAARRGKSQTDTLAEVLAEYYGVQLRQGLSA